MGGGGGHKLVKVTVVIRVKAIDMVVVAEITIQDDDTRIQRRHVLKAYGVRCSV